MLYSGLPLFALVKKTANWFRGWKPFQRRAARKSAIEKERDLHVNTSEPIYTFAEPAQTIAADDFAGSVTEDEAVLSGVRGFKLTLEGPDGTEEILRNVDVFLDATFETEGYNRVALSDGYVFQLRNLNHEPAELKRFFFELEDNQGPLYALLSVNPKKMTRALHIKLERKPNSRFSIVSLPVRLKGRGSSIVAYADVDTSLLPRGHSRDEGEILIKKDGSVLFVSPKISNPVELKDFYVRLPKKESKYWAPLMQSNPHVPFVLKVRPTLNKTSLLTMAVPSLQIGLGKTTAPELYSRTTLGESASSMVMLGINNVLPIAMGIVRPMLKRYGEASVLRFSSGLFVAGGSVALASGLYGLLGTGMMSSLQLTGFITSSVLIALGTNVTRIVQNILISANRGEVVSKKAADDPFALQDKTRSISDYNRGYLWKRLKEVVTQRPTKAARDVVLFQTASMFKNVGTMTFLAFPWLANMAVKGIFGVDPGLDFSASYIPYTAYSLWVLHKLRRMAYKDAVPTQFSAVYGQFKEKISDVVTRLQGLPPEVLADPASPAMQQAAKDLKNSIKALQDVENRQKKKLAQDLTATYEKECLDALKLALDRQGLAPVQTQRAVASLGQAFESLNPREANLWQVLRIPVIRNSVLGITLATMHELSVSNGFAFAMHGLLGNGTAANAFTALALYGATCAGRILGNGLSRRVSEGSMYLISSAFSLAGTMTMIAAGNHVAPLVAGAVIASFGVGNFFSQIYDYATAQRKEYKREISLLINYTMPVAAVLSMPMRRLVGLTGFGGMDLVVSAAALIGSLALTPGMFANSSLRLYFKQGWKRQQGTLYRLFHLRQRTPPPAGGLGSAAQ
ncbi:MAG: hypothetical protein MJ053_01065 [Elusimicrobiaceae bacterium]|nr:hypothetical protein [Elusimicrobiaceae bacterium]